MDVAREASRLRAAAEAKPLRLPVRRRVDEIHHAVTQDGLSVWFTIQESPRSRIHDALFERTGSPPTDAEIAPWIELLFAGGTTPSEAPGIPGGSSRRFEAFDRRQAGD